jgi:hypothetical protein
MRAVIVVNYVAHGVHRGLSMRMYILHMFTGISNIVVQYAIYFETYKHAILWNVQQLTVSV